MTNSPKNKGDRAELEVQELLRRLLNNPSIRRALGAGRKDDVGDIDGVPNTAIQVAWYKDINTAITNKLPDVEVQRENRGVRFGALFIRRIRAKIPWVVVMTPEDWATMWRYAQIGLRVETKRQVKQRVLQRSVGQSALAEGPDTAILHSRGSSTKRSGEPATRP